MDKIKPHLKNDFDRFIKLLPKEEVFEKPLISYDIALKAHYLVCDYFEDSTGSQSVYGVKSLSLLESAIGRQKTSFGGYIKWKTPIEVAASLFFGLVKNHAFHDGNKRTALLTCIYQLYLGGRYVNDKKEKFEELTVRVAANELHKYSEFSEYKSKDDAEVRFISDYLRRKTRKIDKEFYTLTYQEFDNRLKKFDCKLDNPSGNYISVLKSKNLNPFRRLITGKTKDWTKVHQIGFPGWKRQVGLKAVKETLKACELTADKGIDSAVFYHEAEPLYFFIQEFEGPLHRLKDR